MYENGSVEWKSSIEHGSMVIYVLRKHTRIPPDSSKTIVVVVVEKGLV